MEAYTAKNNFKSNGTEEEDIDLSTTEEDLSSGIASIISHQVAAPSTSSELLRHHSPTVGIVDQTTTIREVLVNSATQSPPIVAGTFLDDSGDNVMDDDDEDSNTDDEDVVLHMMSN